MESLLDVNKRQQMRIHILKNYIKDLQCVLDSYAIDYSELRKKYLFQYDFTNDKDKISNSEAYRNNLKHISSIAGSNKL